VFSYSEISAQQVHQLVVLGIHVGYNFHSQSGTAHLHVLYPFHHDHNHDHFVYFFVWFLFLVNPLWLDLFDHAYLHTYLHACAPAPIPALLCSAQDLTLLDGKGVRLFLVQAV
jgi:hypothetical protein